MTLKQMKSAPLKVQMPGFMLVSYCPRCGEKCECPGLVGIRCPKCGAVHDRVAELGDDVR